MGIDMRLLNAARLEPALQLAARKIAKGRLDVVNPHIKLIDRLEKYTPLQSRYDEKIRARLLAKLNINNALLPDYEASPNEEEESKRRGFIASAHEKG